MQNLVLRLTKLLEITVLLSISLLFGITIKFKGDALVNAAGYIPKGSPISITGDMTFEHWNDDDGNLKARPVVTIAEVQLPPKAKAA
jgi:Single-strand binding protein family